ncbi:hypothetical protein CBR_g36726 [Chara braunii]|uniref:DUF659 domain-containing protein n=1 Tax=Chara braunii TaxID=69332 RepID=A0A388LLA8_CHABU|nr:hypothetical protein CBR_g36726 [Chara braunii]|eukprot:GBG83108.1 hypothetical protein CBR_g36726 [Chara braunii]
MDAEWPDAARAEWELRHEIWNKSAYHFDQSHWKKIQAYLAERGWADKRREHGQQGGDLGEEDEDDPERVAEEENEQAGRDCEAPESGGVQGGRRADDDGSAEVPIDVEREEERDCGALRGDKRAVTGIGTSTKRRTSSQPLPPTGAAKKFRQSRMEESFDPKWQQDLDAYFLQWFYVSSIPFHAAGRPEYNTFRRYLATCPSRVHPTLPNLPRISGDGIVQQHKDVAEMLATQRRDVAATGATILTDGRKSIIADQIVNFLAVGSSGAYLLRIVQRVGTEQDTATVVVRQLKKVLNDFGLENVNATCTDSVGIYVAGAKLLAKDKDLRYSRITWLPRFSARHTAKGQTASSSASSGTSGRGRKLICPVQTRFATHYLMLERLLERRHALEEMIISDEWLRQPWRRSLWLQSRWVRQQIRFTAFWDDVQDIVEFMTPVMELLRRLDRGGHVMSRLWSWLERGEKEASAVAQWWVQWGDGVPLLQSIAVRLMHTWTCASPAERNWDVDERIQVKRRNKLGFTKLTRLVEISTNLRLLRCHTRGVGNVLPWEDEDVVMEDERPEPRDSGVRPADKVTDEQVDRPGCADAQCQGLSIRQRQHTSIDSDSNDDDGGYEGSSESEDDMDFDSGAGDTPRGGGEGPRDIVVEEQHSQRHSARLVEERGRGAGGSARGGGDGGSGGQIPLSPHGGRSEAGHGLLATTGDFVAAPGSLSDILGMSMGPPPTVGNARQTPVAAGNTPTNQIVRGLDTDGGVSSSLLMEAAQGMEVLECEGREDPLTADRRERMEDTSRRALGDPPPYAPCSPSVPSSMTGVSPPPWDPMAQMQSIRAACAANKRSWDNGRGGSESRSSVGGTQLAEGRGLHSLSLQSRMKTRPHGLGSVRKVTQAMRDMQPGLVAIPASMRPPPLP